MLAFGVLLEAPWLVPALLTGSTLFLLYLIVCETHGARVGSLAALIALISPATLVMGATWFSEVVSRFYLGIYVLGMIRTLKGGGWIYPTISGFALGYAFNTRPISSVAFGAVGGALCVTTAYRDRTGLAKSIFLFLIPFILMIFACLAWNNHFTGNPFQFTHNAAQPYERLGFGKRAGGHEPNLQYVEEFTPRKAFFRIWENVLPSISFHTLGWGYYRPDMVRSIIEPILQWKWPDVLLLLRIIPLAFPLVLILIPLFHSSRNQYDLLFCGFPLITLVLHFFFYFEGSTWGFSPPNSRYYNESILLGIVPLIAHGISITYSWVRLKFLRFFAGLLLVVLSANTIYSYVLFGKSFRQGWHSVLRDLPPLVREQDIHHAVVFVPGVHAPIGDYPFRNLQDADIVYFRLGPSAKWRLTNSNWRDAYERYFKGRHAYMFENRRLQSLDVCNTCESDKVFER